MDAAGEHCNFPFFSANYSKGNLKKELYERTKFIQSPCKLWQILFGYSSASLMQFFGVVQFLSSGFSR